MKYRKGIAAIVFKRKPKKPAFLLLRRKLNWKGYELLKGGLKGGETEERALKRELREETGIKKHRCVSTNYVYRYPWPKTYLKDNHRFQGASMILFIVEDLDRTDRIRIDKREHSGHRWATAKKALKMLTYSNQRDALRFALKNYF